MANLESFNCSAEEYEGQAITALQDVEEYVFENATESCWKDMLVLAAGCRDAAKIAHCRGQTELEETLNVLAQHLSDAVESAKQVYKLANQENEKS